MSTTNEPSLYVGLVHSLRNIHDKFPVSISDNDETAKQLAQKWVESLDNPHSQYAISVHQIGDEFISVNTATIEYLERVC